MNLALIALAIAGGPLVVAGVLAALVRNKPHGPRARACTIRELPALPIGRVVGVVRAYQKTLVAPLTGTTCVFYRQGRSSWSYFRGTGVWSETAWVPGDSASVEFLLEDDTGVAIMDLANAELEMTKVRLEESLSSRATRVVEQVVVPGQRLEVVGSAIEEADPDAQSLRDPPPARLRIVAAPNTKLFVADRGQ